jgi:6-pyruvoyltetrahydropterin/6-carboxytetrahydropterin synthase
VSWQLVVKKKFSAAHYLENYQGKCENMHGHTFQIEIHIEANELDSSGIAIDFQTLKDYLESILPDHQVLNDVFEFPPSAENLARHFFRQIKQVYPVSKVVIWESESTAASYSES